MARSADKNIFETISRLGAKSDDNDEEKAVKHLLPLNIIGISIFFAVLMGPLHIYFREPFAGFLYIGNGLFALINFWIYVSVHKNYRIFAVILGGFGFLTILVGTIILGGVINSGGVILWGLLISMMALIGLGTKRALYVFITYMAEIALIALLQPFLRQTNNLPEGFVRFVLALTFISVSVLVFRGFTYFIDQRNKAFDLLQQEQEKSDRLLLNILPKDIANILKNEQHIIADHINSVSILFADVVNFTPMSAQMSPKELVELLNEVFSHFDRLVEKYDLEKIKTIGDCYMVASGVPQPRADHAIALANMALEMRSFTTGQLFLGRQLSFRIGINSGPVVAGIIGKKKFSYDLWGDTVNTASRMESHSLGSGIQITEDTYELIKDEFICEPRGVINVKGKGEMNAWLLMDKRRDR